MNYLSLFSGIEAATAAWHPLGWNPLAFAEIDKFPSAVLAHHYPNVPNLGDVTKIKGEDFNGSVDVLVGGSPCTSFSIAGLRKGLDDPRGQLTPKFFQLVDHIRPRWVVWENVPGVLSIDHGRTFGAILQTLGQCGYGFAYRILDAQYFGVPQRRRRIFLVGYPGDWRPAAAVLFERHSLSGHPPPGRSQKEDIAGALTSRFGKNGGCANRDITGRRLVTSALTGCLGSGGPDDNKAQGGFLVSFHGSQDPNVSGDVTHALGRNRGLEASVAFTDHKNKLQVRRLSVTECEFLMGFTRNYTLIPWRGKAANDCPDGPRYKALGNSMCVNVMKWIGQRIEMVDKLVKKG